MEILEESFYARHPVPVARDLLGKVIRHGETAGRIVEVEAYLGTGDAAAHSARGLTERTRVLFGPPGRAYVYLIYGMYECLNFVAEEEGRAGCVLIRALEPVEGIERMFERRRAARTVEDLCRGPGRLTVAMGITRELNGASLTGGSLLMVGRMGDDRDLEIVTTPRIGITKCADLPLRYYERGSRFVSKTRSAG